MQKVCRIYRPNRIGVIMKYYFEKPERVLLGAGVSIRKIFAYYLEIGYSFDHPYFDGLIKLIEKGETGLSEVTYYYSTLKHKERDGFSDIHSCGIVYVKIKINTKQNILLCVIPFPMIFPNIENDRKLIIPEENFSIDILDATKEAYDYYLVQNATKIVDPVSIFNKAIVPYIKEFVEYIDKNYT